MISLLELKYSRVPVGGQTFSFYCSFAGRLLVDARIYSSPEFLSFEKSVVVDCRARSILSVDLDDKMISQKNMVGKRKTRGSRQTRFTQGFSGKVRSIQEVVGGRD